MSLADAEVRNESPRAGIVRNLRAWIDDGVLEKGVPIPSERELCKRLGANRRTLQGALKFLEAEKLIVRQGPRTRVVPEKADVQFDGEGMLSNTAAVLSGIRTPDASHGSGWTDAVVKAIMRNLEEMELYSLVLNPRHLRKEEGRLLMQRPFGLFIVDPAADQDEGLLSKMLRNGVPVASYGDGKRYESFDSVISDHEQGAFELARAMIESGSRKIMMLSVEGASFDWQRRRASGYGRAMREAGIEAMAPLVETPLGAESFPVKERWTVKSRYHAGCLAEHFAAHGRPDAIWALSDGEVFNVASACRILGLEPGRDIAIAGYDNYWRECPEREFEPYVPPFTVDKRNPEIGKEMVKLLVQRKGGQLPPEPQMRVVRPELVQISR